MQNNTSNTPVNTQQGVSKTTKAFKVFDIRNNIALLVEETPSTLERLLIRKGNLRNNFVIELSDNERKACKNNWDVLLKEYVKK